MAAKFGFILIVLMIGTVFLFGCTQQAKKNETTQIPVFNESQGNITTNQTQTENNGSETNVTIPVETRKAEVGIGFSSSASTVIGKGLDSFNVTIGRIEAHGPDGWVVVSDKTATIDLKTINGGRQQVSLAKTTLGMYDKIRINVISATSVYVTTTSIPGVMTGKRTTKLTIPASIVELPLNLNMTNDSDTYSVTVTFDINQIDPATISSFDASSAIVTAKTIRFVISFPVRII